MGGRNIPRNAIRYRSSAFFGLEAPSRASFQNHPSYSNFPFLSKFGEGMFTDLAYWSIFFWLKGGYRNWFSGSVNQMGVIRLLLLA